MTEICFLIATLVVLVLLSACLSGSETALFSLSAFQLKSYRKSEDSRWVLVSHLMERPRDVLVTILILNILSNILVQNTVSGIFNEFESFALKVGLPLAITLIFGEVLPKSIAILNNSAIAYRVAPLIHRAAVVLSPFRKALTWITSSISRYLFFFLKEEKTMSPDELRHVLKTSEESKVLLASESRLIGGVLDLEQTSVKERMRPREEILFYDLQEPLEKLDALMIERQTTRVPICDGDLEKIVGILTTRKYFLAKPMIQKPNDLIAVLKKPYYVPESTRAYSLLRMMRERSESLAIVVDEYGSISGLITQEDLIEAVVGEISDLRDEKSLYTRSGEDVIIASGKLELDQFAEIFGEVLESKENVVTLGGWLIEQLGDIPQTGAKYRTDRFLFYVLAAEPHRVRRIYVRRIKGA